MARKRDTVLGGILIVVLPVLIVVVAGWLWWANLGSDDMLDMGEPRLSTPIDGM
jgi:hypothetical protein